MPPPPVADPAKKDGTGPPMLNPKARLFVPASNLSASPVGTEPSTIQAQVQPATIMPQALQPPSGMPPQQSFVPTASVPPNMIQPVQPAPVSAASIIAASQQTITMNGMQTSMIGGVGPAAGPASGVRNRKTPAEALRRADQKKPPAEPKKQPPPPAQPSTTPHPVAAASVLPPGAPAPKDQIPPPAPAPKKPVVTLATATKSPTPTDTAATAAPEPTVSATLRDRSWNGLGESNLVHPNGCLMWIKSDAYIVFPVEDRRHAFPPILRQALELFAIQLQTYFNGYGTEGPKVYFKFIGPNSLRISIPLFLRDAFRQFVDPTSTNLRLTPIGFSDPAAVQLPEQRVLSSLDPWVEDYEAVHISDSLCQFSVETGTLQFAPVNVPRLPSGLFLRLAGICDLHPNLPAPTISDRNVHLTLFNTSNGLESKPQLLAVKFPNVNTPEAKNGLLGFGTLIFELGGVSIRTSFQYRVTLQQKHMQLSLPAVAPQPGSQVAALCEEERKFAPVSNTAVALGSPAASNGSQKGGKDHRHLNGHVFQIRPEFYCDPAQTQEFPVILRSAIINWCEIRVPAFDICFVANSSTMLAVSVPRHHYRQFVVEVSAIRLEAPAQPKKTDGTWSEDFHFLRVAELRFKVQFTALEVRQVAPSDLPAPQLVLRLAQNPQPQRTNQPQGKVVKLAVGDAIEVGDEYFWVEAHAEGEPYEVSKPCAIQCLSTGSVEQEAEVTFEFPNYAVTMVVRYTSTRINGHQKLALPDLKWQYSKEARLSAALPSSSPTAVHEQADKFITDDAATVGDQLQATGTAYDPFRTKAPNTRDFAVVNAEDQNGGEGDDAETKRLEQLMVNLREDRP